MSENSQVEMYLNLSPENNAENSDAENLGLESIFQMYLNLSPENDAENSDAENLGLESIFPNEDELNNPPQEKSFELDDSSDLSIKRTPNALPQENIADDSWLSQLFRQDDQISSDLYDGLTTEFEWMYQLTSNSTFASETIPRKGPRSKRSSIDSNWGASLSRIPNFNDVNAFRGGRNQTTSSKKSKRVSNARKCLHCGIENTPQWRQGPMGANTLCNACGIRYKSGGLVPEYRPAKSPTFMATAHSNSRRKVTRLRTRRQPTEQQDQQQHSHIMGQGSLTHGFPKSEGADGNNT